MGREAWGDGNTNGHINGHINGHTNGDAVTKGDSGGLECEHAPAGALPGVAMPF